MNTKRWIRTGQMGDLEALAALEAACFPPEEAADRETLARRLLYYPDHFWLMTQGNRLISFVDGFCTDEPDLTDDMYENAALHNEKGAWQMIFGVNTHPDFRRQGCARALMERAAADARAAGRLGLVLTCKEELTGFYHAMGFVDEGVTEKSVHGGAVWRQMRLTL